MMHYVLLYELVDNFIERRAQLRDAHLALARESHARGEMVIGGAFSDPTDGAIIVFRSETPAIAERYAENDPYVKAGLVTSWRVRRWEVAIGGE